MKSKEHDQTRVPKAFARWNQEVKSSRMGFKYLSSGWILMVPKHSLLKYFTLTFTRHKSSKFEGSGPPLRSKDTQFAAVELPKCLEGPHNTYNRSTNRSRLLKQKQEQGLLSVPSFESSLPFPSCEPSLLLSVPYFWAFHTFWTFPIFERSLVLSVPSFWAFPRFERSLLLSVAWFWTFPHFEVTTWPTSKCTPSPTGWEWADHLQPACICVLWSWLPFHRTDPMYDVYSLPGKYISTRYFPYRSVQICQIMFLYSDGFSRKD